MESVQVYVRGMKTNQCKLSVVNNLSRLQGIITVKVDMDNDMVTLTGDGIDLTKVKSTVEGIGYLYEELNKN